MDSFRWDASFLTGLDTVDEQHHHLVDVLNRFGEMVVRPTGVSAAEAEDLFGELTRYAQYHFTEEEALMVRAGIDPHHLEVHRGEHASFVDEVVRLHAQAGSAASSALLSFLVHWLTYHILGMDRSMARQLAAIRAGATPAQACARADEERDTGTGMLLRSLQQLFREVTTRNRALHELNQTLEEKVRERTRALERLAMTDMLTGLSNRRSAMAALQSHWDAPAGADTPLSCLVLDADGFKRINDTYGHAAGDEVLQELAWRLLEAVRTDDRVFRMGGDEFLVLCPGTPLAGAVACAEKLRAHVGSLRVRTGDEEWLGSISVGVAERDAAMTGVDDLLKRADEALYAAKAAGRNRVCPTHPGL
ncbi:MAG TPA: GGDEF domain-containing protein, partial [Gemmatimonadales bacterium]|nr:GGDEF domain-containing protein [Gemmatimonadales bacterium]